MSAGIGGSGSHGFAIYKVGLRQAPSSFETISDYFGQAAAELHTAWHDPIDDAYVLVITGAAEPEAIAIDTARITGGELLELGVSELDLEGLGIYSNPAGTLLIGRDPHALMAAAPPRLGRWTCPGCLVDLAIEDHLPECQFASN